MKINISSLQETKDLAMRIARFVSSKNEFYILLSGDLGAGKTTFSKFLIKELGINEVVSSPTFVILNQYKNDSIRINHVDAYRLTSDSENDMYLEEFYDSINIIEWYENMNLTLQDETVLKIDITIIDENTRKFNLDKEI